MSVEKEVFNTTLGRSERVNVSEGYVYPTDLRLNKDYVLWYINAFRLLTTGNSNTT